MIKDKVVTPDIGLKGLVTIEMFDAKTGKLENKVQKENFISIGSKKWWAKMQRDSIIYKTPEQLRNTIQGLEMSFSENYFFNRIVLTDDASPEQPDTEKLPKGNVIGQVDIRNVATSAHPTAGVLNLNESFVDREKIHIVGDFGTDRCNGTFQSIEFINCSRSYNTYENYLQAYYGITEYLDYKGSGTSKNLTTKIGNKLIYSEYDSYVKPFYYFDLDNPALGLQIMFETDDSFQRYGLTNDGENIYVSLNTNDIRGYNLNGDIVYNVTTEVPQIRGIYFDVNEDVFYVTSNNSANNPINERWNMCMYKVDKTDGNILEIFPFIYRNSDLKVCGRLADGSFVFSFVFWFDGYSHIIQNFDKGYSCCFDVMGTRDYSSVAIDKNTNEAYTISFYNIDNCNVAKIHPMALCSRVLLPSPQTKTNTQTMKVTYDLYYDDWTKL